MRVPVKQRASRSSPSSATSARAKNKRRVSSDGTPPAKIKKRKLPPLPPDVPPEAAPAAGASVAPAAVAAPKRKPAKKVAATPAATPTTSTLVKKVTVVTLPVKIVAAKKPKVTKALDSKATPAKGKAVAKSVPSVVTEKKIAGAKAAKKLQSRKLSTASASAEVAVAVDVVKDIAKEVVLPEKGAAELPGVAAPKKAPKKAVVKGDAKAKAPRVAKVKDDAGKKAAKAERKLGAKKLGDAKRVPPPSDGKKSRRKAPPPGVGVGVGVGEGEGATPDAGPSADLFADSQFDVIDEVARNLMKPGCTVAANKTKESGARKESGSAIKNKVVAGGGGKNKKQLTKKTPKSVDDEVVAGKKVDGVENEISDVATPATISVAFAAAAVADEKLENNLPDKDLSDKEIKSKIVIKKTLKEKKPQVNIVKKKVMFKKTSPKVGATVKAAKVTFQVMKGGGGGQKAAVSRKRAPKKGKKSSDGQQVAAAAAAAGSSFQDDYNSSTSDDCTLDLLLRRQKQLKQEELNSSPPTPPNKACGVEPKPGVATLIKTEAVAATAVASATPKNKTKIKTEAKTADVAVSSPPAKKLAKKPTVVVSKSKSKSKPLAVKKKSPSTLNKLKLAAARKKAIVSKVKRMRSNEVSKLGSGSESEQRARRMKLFGFWSGPKRHRVASLNALAKVHCLYENESRGALMSVCAKPASPGDPSAAEDKPEAVPTEAAAAANTRTLRSGPGRRGIGQHWDQQTTSSSSSSEDNGQHSDSSSTPAAATLSLPPSYKQKQLKAKAAKPAKKVAKPRRHEAVMDLKDMVVRKRMASLNASAILSASYSPIEKLQKKQQQRSVKDDDSPQPADEDESHVRKKKCKKKSASPTTTSTSPTKKVIEREATGGDDVDGRNIIELATANNKKVATVIVNQDTDVTITGVYVNSTTHRSSTTHEGYCSIAGMQYLISSTSHTKTEARAVATETLLHAPSDLVPPVPSLHPPEPPLQPPMPMKSYTPLGALSNMQPGGTTLSPLARRHGCTSAFSAPPLAPPVPPPPPPPSAHHHHRHGPPAPEPPPQAPPYLHGYYQPAGPLISAHHHHSLPKASVLPTLEASPTSTPPTNAPSAPPPISASTSSGTRGGDESSDNDVVITASSCHNPTYSSGPPSQSAPTYRYQTYPLPPAPPPHHQYGYPSQYPTPQYYPVAGGQGGGYAPAPPPPPPHYHNPDLCYTTPNYPPAPQYYHKSYSTPPPPVTYPRRYGPPPPAPHPSQYYPAELYQPPPEQQSGRQMVATASTSGYQQPAPADAYPQQPPAPPVVPMVDSYPPPPGPGYYPGYPPPAPPPCYSHSPPARSLAYIDAAYQGCPCPMQSCPKNVRTGPLTGEGKGPRPSAAYAQHLPLPPVALALPSEPPHAGGPPSPARGSAGTHPTPSPRLATARGAGGSPCAAAAAAAAASKAATAAEQVVPSESRAVGGERTSSGGDVGLLAIHTPSSAGSAPRAGTVHVGKHRALTQRAAAAAQRAAAADAADLGRVGLKVEGDAEATRIAAAAAAADSRKRKSRADCAAAPKPKRRGVAPADEAAARGRCSGQPLSSANSCSQHGAKQNAKKRKIGGNVEEVLAENKEPSGGGGEPAAARARSKEPKPANRPRLCPSGGAKVAKKAVGISERLAEPPVCDPTATTLGSNGVVVPPTSTKSAGKAGPKGGAKSAAARKCRLNKIVRSVSDEAASVAVTAGRRKVAGKPRLGKPADAGKLKGRRKTDSDAMRVSHMLRSHGMQDVWEGEAAAPAKCKAGGAARKPTGKNAAAGAAGEVDICAMLALRKASFVKPKWSNGWCWEGEAFQAKVHLNSEGTSVERICYPSMRHTEGDIIRPLDCILLKSGARRVDLPYVAKVAQLWENPDDGEMMVSLLWYYRPEHTDQGRRVDDMRDEIFASKHKDTNSVACIEDKCYVLTFNEYCRYRAESRRQQEGAREVNPLVPLPSEHPRASRLPTSSVSPDMVFFCRRVYDFRQKRILKNPC